MDHKCGLDCSESLDWHVQLAKKEVINNIIDPVVEKCAWELNKRLVDQLKIMLSRV